MFSRVMGISRKPQTIKTASSGSINSSIKMFTRSELFSEKLFENGKNHLKQEQKHFFLNFAVYINLF